MTTDNAPARIAHLESRLRSENEELRNLNAQIDELSTRRGALLVWIHFLRMERRRLCEVGEQTKD